jgi:hypothetical protein
MLRQREGQVMPNWSQRAIAAEVASGLLHPGKVYQVIFNVNVRTTPTSARITYEPMLDAFGFVSLYQDGVQVRGAIASEFATGHFRVTFTDLPQNTEFVYRIDVVDPRPKSEQLPGGIVSFQGILETGLRTATVRLRWLKELAGEAEVTFLTRLYDWDGNSGPAISPIVQYGRGHMDPDGNRIGDPFGPPINLARAPDNLAIYTWAGAETSSAFVQLVTSGPTGLHVVGVGPLDEFPNDAPRLQLYDYYAVMKGQTIIALPGTEGSFHIPFSYMSALGDYVFEVDGFVDGNVSKFVHLNKRSLKLEPRHFMRATAHFFAPIATVLAGEGMLMFQLTPDGRIMRAPPNRGAAAGLEPIGEISAERFVAVGRPDGQADLVALRADGAVLHARAGREGKVAWRELAAKLSGTPAALHGPDGTLQVFGLDESGTLVHTAVGGAARAPRWDRWEQGLSGPRSCAANRKGETHVFARRDGHIVHARLALRQGKSASPRFEVIDAPFRGPGMIGTTEDGRFAALGYDERGIFWLKLWDGRRWQPDGKRWEKIGTLDDVLAERNQPPRRQSAKRGARRKRRRG